jgi:hypothetical protein
MEDKFFSPYFHLCLFFVVVIVVVFVLYGGVEALGKGKQPEKVKQQRAYIYIT